MPPRCGGVNTGYQTVSGASGGSNEYAVEPVRLALHAIEGVQPMPAGSVRVVGLASPGLIAPSLLRPRAPRRLIGFGLRADELDRAMAFGPNRTISVTAADAVPSYLDLDVVTAASELALALATQTAREWPGGAP